MTLAFIVYRVRFFFNRSSTDSTHPASARSFSGFSWQYLSTQKKSESLSVPARRSLSLSTATPVRKPTSHPLLPLPCKVPFYLIQAPHDGAPLVSTACESKTAAMMNRQSNARGVFFSFFGSQSGACCGAGAGQPERLSTTPRRFRYRNLDIQGIQDVFRSATVSS